MDQNVFLKNNKHENFVNKTTCTKMSLVKQYAPNCL